MRVLERFSVSVIVFACAASFDAAELLTDNGVMPVARVAPTEREALERCRVLGI